MPYTLNFYDGTTTYDLTDGTYILGCEYVPNNGSDNDKSVSDTVVVHLSGTGAQMLAVKETIENWLAWAKSYYTTKVGDKIYLRAKLDAADDLGSSLIHSGFVEWSGRAPTTTIRAGYAMLRIVLTRDNWWEEALVTLPLTNGHGTDVTSGLQVDNRNDSTRDNWVEIDGADIEGTLPAPILLDFENTYNSGDRMGRLRYSNNFRSNPNSLQTVLEGEDATGVTPIADTGSSGGNYISVSWSATQSEIVEWTIPSALLQNAKGNLCKVHWVGEGITVPGYWLRVKMQMALTDIFYGAWKYVERDWHDMLDLGTMRFPPYLLSEYSSVYPLNLVIEQKQTSSTSRTMYLDALHIHPVDTYRSLVPKGYNTGYQASLVDDGIDGVVYTDGWSTAGKVGNYVGYGATPEIMPGVDNRLSFLMFSSTIGGYYTPERTGSVIIKYKPRRRAL